MRGKEMDKFGKCQAVLLEAETEWGAGQPSSVCTLRERHTISGPGEEKFIVDPLSELLSLMHMQSPRLGMFKFAAPWGIAHPQLPGMICHFIAEGECLYLPSGQAKPVKLQAGDFIAFPYGTPHVLSSHAGISGTPVAEILEKLGLQVWVPEQNCLRPVCWEGSKGGQSVVVFDLLCTVHNPKDNPLLRALPPFIHLKAEELQPSWLNFLTQTLMHNDTYELPGYAAMVSRIIELMFILAVRTYLARMHDASEMGSGWLRGLLHPKIGRALQAMHRAPERDWTVAQLAAEAGMSRTPFAEVFHDCLGQTPIQYLTEWRMFAATRDLAGGVPANVIASQLGYASSASFARTFKRLQGMTPGDYRRRYERAGEK